MKTDIESKIFKFLIALATIALAITFSCGDTDRNVGNSPPAINIVCSPERVCVVLIWGADDVEAFSNGRLLWYDYHTSQSEKVRLTYREKIPKGVFEVVSCNDYGCTNKIVDLR